eukprot:COSAG01_NODE_70654_length_258_cov_0.641509_1_plen_52_part_01
MSTSNALQVRSKNTANQRHTRECVCTHVLVRSPSGSAVKRVMIKCVKEFVGS